MVSWPRSHGRLDFSALIGDSDDGSSYSWTPSEVAAEERRYMPRPAPAPVDPPLDPASQRAQWMCLACRTDDWSVDDDGLYFCMQCGGYEFFNVGEPAKLETATGTWMYVPHRSTSRSVSGGSSHGSVEGSPVKSPAAARAKFPDAPSSAGGYSERAESEAPTTDPVIDPDNDGSHRRRRRRGSSSSLNVPAPDAQAHGHGGPADTSAKADANGELLSVMRQLLNDRKKKDTESESSWTSAKGPARGVKWRGGAPPLPPKWQYQQSDLRAFSKFERKVETWVLQSRNYMTASEMGLALYVSLTGEAESEAEHFDLKKVNHKDGVQYILDELRGPLQQRILFQKRKLLSDFENVKRNNQETVRQYLNRYRRIERDLDNVGIQSSAMYDAESRGNRVLERCLLAPDLQRLVLIGAGNDLHYEKIYESLCLQFPDFRPSPPLFFPGNQWGNSGKGNNKGSSSSSSTGSTTSTSASSQRSSSSSFSGKSSSKGKSFPRRAFQTEHAEGETDVAGDNDEFEEAVGDESELGPIAEGNEDENDDDRDGEECDADETALNSADIAELAQVLTVTSKKLQASVLGRKFSGRKSIEERKKNSSCSACGQIGHWAGDSACPVSAERGGKRDGKGHQTGGSNAANPKPGNFGGKNIKKTYVVGLSHDDHQPDDPEHHQVDPHSNYFTFTTNLVLGADLSTAWVTEAIDLGGFMVLDTACQRSCCGEPWLKTHAEILQRHDLRVKLVECVDHFQFGSGAPVASSTRAYFPASMPGQETQGVIFGASVLKTGIPFLASRTLLQRLGCVIDMHTMTLTFTNLGLSMPLTSRHGHLAVSIVHFAEGVSSLSCWKKLSKPELWHEPDPELICAPGILNKGSIRDQPPQAIGTLGNAACEPLRSFLSMGDCGDQGDVAHLQGLQGDVPHGEVWTDAQTMDDKLGASPRVGATAQRSSSDAGSGRPVNMSAPGVPKIRQHPRVFQQVQEMPAAVQMGARQRRLGPSWKSSVATFFALAASLIFHNPTNHGHADQGQGQDFLQEGHYFESQSEAESPSCGTSRGRGVSARDGSQFRPGMGRSGGLSSELRRWSGRLCELGRGDGPTGHLMMDEWLVDSQHVTRVHHVPRKMLFCEADFFEVPDPCPVHLRQLCPECIVEIQYEDGRNQTLTYEWGADSGAFHMKSTWTGKTIFKLKHSTHAALISNLGRKTLRHSVRQVVNLAQLEHEVLTSSSSSTANPLQRHKHRPRVDLLETFAGRAGLSLRAKSYGLKALEPIDFNTGFDLNKAEHQAHVDHLLDFYRPLFLMQGIDCTDWCLLQDNVNYIRRKILLLMRRAKARKLLKKVVDWCVKQIQDGRFFLLENPVTSRIWVEPLILKLAKLPGVSFSICHSGAYGATNSKNQMIRKTFRFMGNCPHVLARLTRRLSPEQLRQCVKLEGKETTLSQHYPDEMVKQILIGIKQTAMELEPQRFMTTSQSRSAHSVWVTQHNDNPEDWKPLFESAQRTFDTTRIKSYVLATSDPLWKSVSELVKWHKLERVQIAEQPTMLRLPTHIPHTHRGWALLYNDGNIDIVVEDLSDVRHPRARFRKPVNIGIFFFGHAEASQQAPQQGQDLQPQDDDPQSIIAHNVDGISFPKLPGLSPQLKTILSRLHRNLGHPHANELKKMLAMNGIKDQRLYDAVEALTCESCLRVKGPNRPEPSGIPQDVCLQFADALQIDLFYVRDIRSVNYVLLGIIDECTHLHMALLLRDRSPEEVEFQFVSHWARAFGFPLRIKADPDGSFRGYFESSMDQAGVFVDFIPAESHHRIGLIERHNSVLRDLMERIIDSRAVSDEATMGQAVIAACFAKNSCTWSSGRPPFIAAFGRIPRMGTNLLSDSRGLVTGQTRDELQKEADLLRIEAQQHLAAMSIDSNLRRALLRKSTTTGPQDLPIGSIAAYWRWTAKSGKKRGGYKLARILGRDPDGKSMWLQAGTNTIKVAPHQIRPALGFEQWTPSYEDIKALRSAAENLQHGELVDEQIPPPAPEQEHPGFDELQPPIAVPQQEFSGAEFVPVPREPVPSTPPPMVFLDQAPLQEEAVQTDPYVQQPINLNMSSPTYRQTIIQNQSFGMTEGQRAQPKVNIPVRKTHRSRSTTPVPRRSLRDLPRASDAALPSAPSRPSGSLRDQHQHESQVPGDATPVLPDPSQTEVITIADDDTDQASVPQLPIGPDVRQTMPALEPDVGDTAPVTPDELKRTSAKRSIEDVDGPAEQPSSSEHQVHRVSLHEEPQHEKYSNSNATLRRDERSFDFTYDDVDGIHLLPEGFDGSNDIYMPYAHKVYMNAYRKDKDYHGTGSSDESDADTEDFRGKKTQIAPTLTRQERKALDKEIPWQTILKMDQPSIKAYVEAAQAEERSWIQFGSVRALTDAEAQTILNDKKLKRRILRSRAAYRDKSKGAEALKAKCRVVAIGCLDPDLWTLQREAATPTRQSEFILYAIFLAGANGKLLGGNTGYWLLWGGDVKTAFLQGDPEEREQPLYLLPPQDGITKLAKTFTAKLYLVRGNIYGLANAPRTWCRHVIATLLRAGYVQSSLDKMLFFLYKKLDGSKHPVLCAVAIVYVDDFLLTHDSRYDRNHLLQLFKWGSQNELTVDNPLEFKGKEIALKRNPDTGELELHLNQRKFISEMKGGKVDRKRLKQTLDDKDLGEFRSVSGCLQWLAGQTRPDVAAVVSLCSKGAKSTYEDLQNMYSAVEHLHATMEHGIVLLPVPISYATMLVTFADSSWANAEGFASQHGSLVLLADPKATDVISPGLILDWKSSRSSRVCRSTLAAEASAADASVDRASFLNYQLCELLLNRPAFHISSKELLRQIQVTDCRSLYDVLVSENPRTEEKRTIVSIRSAQQFLTRENVFWVPTGLQWADGLTKVCSKLMETFACWLRKPWIQLHEGNVNQQRKMSVNFCQEPPSFST